MLRRCGGRSQYPFCLDDQQGTAVTSVLTRSIIKPYAQSADHVPLEVPAPGAYILLGGRSGVARALAELIVEAGGQATVAPEKLWRDPVAFGRWLGDIKTQSPIKGLVHLGPLDDPIMPDGTTLKDWRERAERDVRSFFPVLQMSADDLHQGGTVIAASAMGGVFARGSLDSEGPAPWPLAAGNIGLLKCLSLEWPGCRFKAVDLDPLEATSAQARHLFRELFLRCGRREVGYPGGRRTIFRTEPAFLRAARNKSREPTRDWVVLGVGGAHGITAEALRDVACAGAKLVIVGRTPAPGEEAPETAALARAGALRQYFISSARATNENVSPSDIQRRLARVLRDREIRANLNEFKGLGAQVDYRSADLRDPEQVNALIEDVYARYGRIDAVYFGIGLLEDRLLVDKKPDSVDRVIATKIDSAFLLSQCLRPDSLKFFGFFTSVAGRYGNRGQTDYGAANEILNQFAWILQKRWGENVKVAAINWGPWAGTTHGTGMVTADVRKQFEERGVSLVEPDEGRTFMTRELMYGPTHEVESVAGNDPWEYLEASHEPIPTSDATPRPDQSFPLIGTGRISVRDKTTSIIRKSIDLVSDPYLDHHRVDGVPIMPFVVAAEYMAETANLIDPNLVVTELRDIRMLAGISVKDALDFEIRARRSGNEVATECWLMAAKPRLAYRATAQLAERVPEPVPSPPAKRNGGLPVRMRDAYREWLFHGPVFQTVTDVDSVDERHLLARGLPTQPQSFYPPAKSARWLFDPGITDGALQMILIWSRVLRDHTPLPTFLARLSRFGTGPLTGPLGIELTFNSKVEDPAIACDIRITDETGNLRLEMKGVEAMSTKELNRIAGGWTGQAELHFNRP